jgi:para-aminobenzoate synthetase component 1
MIEQNVRDARTFQRAVHLNCDPFDVAIAFHDRDCFSFLDSSRRDPNQGRYSLLAWEPELVFRTKGNTVYWRSAGKWQFSGEQPLLALDRLTSSWGAIHSDDIRFAGGAIGYLGYELFRYVEEYKNLRARDDLGLPDCHLAVYDMILVFDHQTRQWMLAGRGESGDRLDRRVDEIQRTLQFAKPTFQNFSNVPSRVIADPPNLERKRYTDGVRKALEYISAGDIYQVNLSQRFSYLFNSSAFELFSRLRAISPSFYGSYLNCGEHVVISSSPELFLRRAGLSVETRPIKGTRPRGITPDADEFLRRDLITSEKEKAELTMIVDLERNDLGRVCEYGSVEVVDHRYLDELPTVHHTVSTVRGRLRKGTRTVDLLRATFPGGSITGCPKMRAIQVIDEIEEFQRHVYTGALGFIGVSGDLTLNVAIRTMVVARNHVCYQVGSGIVADSNPEQEFEEMLHKAAAMERALRS